jgi:hypothetical protein
MTPGRAFDKDLDSGDVSTAAKMPALCHQGAHKLIGQPSDQETGIPRPCQLSDRRSLPSPGLPKFVRLGDEVVPFGKHPTVKLQDRASVALASMFDTQNPGTPPPCQRQTLAFKAKGSWL